MQYEVVRAADIYSRKDAKSYAYTSEAYDLGTGVVLHMSRIKFEFRHTYSN